MTFSLIIVLFPDILYIYKLHRGDIIFLQLIRNRKFVKKLLLIGGSITGVYLFVAIIVTVVLVAREDNSPPPIVLTPPQINPVQEYVPEISYEYEEEEEEPALNLPPARTNFLFLGLDNNLLTDGIMVGSFYHNEGYIKLMSIPRDMYTRIPEHRLTQMREHGLHPPTTLRINELRAFGGRIHGIYYLKAQLGEMLGVTFDYYVEVELAAFRRVVDAIGGVEMYIPQWLVYSDPYQNLHINIPPGMQTLNGQMAEGVVRFRNFPTGDLQRNAMQMEFMNQLIRQVLTRDALMANPITLIQIVVNDVNTNFSLIDALGYISYIRNISPDGISTFTMPGGVGSRGGRSWFLPDVELLPRVINQIFYYMPGEYDDEDNEEYDNEENNEENNEESGDEDYDEEYNEDYNGY